jgi:hypothetical protein
MCARSRRGSLDKKKWWNHRLTSPLKRRWYWKTICEWPKIWTLTFQAQKSIQIWRVTHRVANWGAFQNRTSWRVGIRLKTSLGHSNKRVTAKLSIRWSFPGKRAGSRLTKRRTLRATRLQRSRKIPKLKRKKTVTCPRGWFDYLTKLPNPRLNPLMFITTHLKATKSASLKVCSKSEVTGTTSPRSTSSKSIDRTSKKTQIGLWNPRESVKT